MASDGLFLLKEVPYLGKKVKIVLQNENGPCPLLAITNGLLLRGLISLPESKEFVTLDELLAVVAGRMLDANAETCSSPTKNLDEQRLRHPAMQGIADVENVRKNVDDAIAILPKLATGVDVNPRFHSTKAFEFTDEVAIFDLLDVSLFHGWIVDPEDEASAVIGQMSYNQVVEYMINMDIRLSDSSVESHAKLNGLAQDNDVRESLPLSADSPVKLKLIELSGSNGDDWRMRCVFDYPDEVHDLPSTSACKTNHASTSKATGSVSASEMHDYHLISNFLSSNASQLTFQGLYCVCAEMRDGQLGVFFRNNHFSTILKRGTTLHLLVTDLGYKDEPSVVWETLTDVSGNTHYLDGRFNKFEALSSSSHDNHNNDQTSEAPPELWVRTQTPGNDDLLHQSNAASAVQESEAHEDAGDSEVDGVPLSSPTLPYGAVESMYSPDVKSSAYTDHDFALALQLQEEMNEGDGQARQNTAGQEQHRDEVEVERRRLLLEQQQQQMLMMRQRQMEEMERRKKDKCSIM